MSTFEELRAKKAVRRQGCPACGAGTDGGIAVNLRGRKASDHIAGRSIQFCEQHAVATYEALVALLDESAKRAPRDRP